MHGTPIKQEEQPFFVMLSLLWQQSLSSAPASSRMTHSRVGAVEAIVVEAFMEAAQSPRRAALFYPSKGAYESVAQGNPAQSAALAAGLRARAVRRAKHRAGRSHTALRA